MTKPQNIIAQIDKNVKKKQWECLVDDCSETAINSHLIQQNGILSNISIKGHLVELKMVDAYKWDKKKSPIEFRSVGISQALTHKVFCNTHDTNIFKPIENTKANFESYESFLLFSYRAICAEISKKRLAIEKYTRLINANTLIGKIDKEPLKLVVKGNELGIKDLNALKKELENEIKSNSKMFTYFIYKYPKIPVYASAVFSATDLDFQREDGALDLENIYIHILPLTEETLILVGYHNKYASKDTQKYCHSWEKLSDKELEFKLTGLFVSNIENWGISPDYFEKIQVKKKEKYIELLRKNISYYGVSQEADFNFFEVK
ncbi:hypothetical protein EGM88_14695 [Aureibaculum marinum]|uniref:Uncharacterized protein n=1 Tax=Aureibaculum marinum TaxID=2487930 RepID=A0A3N4N8E8_9FLAO|nr:hypothetical protein [Aureibaculum marinum]RPD91625.1 hypothetical protein EGM88_14695 [Aureibaculum marinum]